MPLPIDWTPERIKTFKKIAVTGVNWDMVGAAIGVSRNACIEKCRDFPDIMAARKKALTHVYVEPNAPRDRNCLPSGHPISWGAITAGTCLEGAQYDGPRWNWATAPETTMSRGD